MNLFNFKTKKQEPVAESKTDLMTFNRPTEWGNDWKYDYSKPFVNTRASGQFIPFGIDNAYPNILLEMYYSSPFHSAIVDFKNNALTANGYVMTNTNTSVEGKILYERVMNQINEDWIWKFTLEYLIHNRIAVMVHKKAGKTVRIEPMDVNEVRESRDGLGYWVCEDWIRRRNEAEYFPKYSKTGNAEESIKVFQRLGPGQKIYALPQYATASNWIWLDGQIAFFQKQNIENSINPSAIIHFYEPIANEKEKEEFVHSLNRSFASAKNAGKILTFFSKSKETAPEITISESNKLDKSFAASQENIIKNVAYAHQINPAILGISPAGQLGATQQLNDAYSIFLQNWLKPTQIMIDNYITEIINMLGVKGEFKLNENTTLL
jgi:hypothetical protein